MQPYFMQIYYECSINGFALCEEDKIVGLRADKVKTKLPRRYLLLQTESYIYIYIYIYIIIILIT